MAFARDVYTASGGQTDFTITYNYQTAVDVKVYVNGSLKTVGSSNDYILSSPTNVKFNSGLTANDKVVLLRSTSQSARTVDYTAGLLSEADLDADSIQAFYMAQESIDSAANAMGLDSGDNWNAQTKIIHLVKDPVVAQDAATKKSTETLITAALIGTLPDPIAISNGGTGATTASAARTALGLVIGTNVLPELGVVSQGDAQAGVSTSEKIWTAVRVKEAINALGPSSANLNTVPIMAGGMTSRSSAGAQSGLVELATNKIMVRSFDFATGADEFVQFTLPFPKRWDNNTDKLTAQFAWTAASGSGTVLWGIQALALSNDDAMDQAFGTIVLASLDTLITANDVHVTSITADITPSGTPVENDTVIFQILRDVSGDSLGVDAKLLWCKIHWTSDTGTDA